MARDFNREQMIRGGFLKHRETGFVNKWRQRYVEFKFTQSGRITFVVYKDQSPSAANEVTQVSIEEYGGLDSTLKLDGEKNVFAIITTHSTECFATESGPVLRDWVEVIQEYFGKELVMNISVPHKQNVLRAGRGQIRVRNTGFTITTNDSPPKCQCTWQILHIRKFGGSETFRFETGSKCPSGEYLYCINTEDNAKLKRVFRDLSVHKPIFADDRMGRRMTHEHNMLQKMRSGGDHGQLEARYSVPSSDPPMYENHERIFQRRVSVPHDSTGTQSFRSLPSTSSLDPKMIATANTLDSRVYCNVDTITSRMQGNHNPNSLTTYPIHEISSPERSYYNMSHYSNAVMVNRQRKKASESPNDSDSDEDFVTVPQSVHTQNEYYNLRDALASRSVPPADETGRQTNYENFLPPASQPFPRFAPVSTHASNRSPPLTTKTEVASLTKANIAEIMNSSLRQTSHQNSHSEEEDCDEDARHRTTSIVGNVLISSHFNSRSCDDLTSSVPPLRKTIRESSSSNFSDSEVLSDHNRENPKLVTDQGYVELVAESHFQKPLQGKPSESLAMSEWSASGGSNKRSRPTAYDHLVPREQHIHPSHSLTQTPTFVPSSSGTSNAAIQQGSRGSTDVSESVSRNSQHGAPSPDHVATPRKETTFNRKVKLTKRVHLYEDVDFQDEPSTNISHSTSPESSLTPLKQEDSVRRYKRKVSLTGRFHSYEDVVSLASESQDLRSESSTPEAPSDWVMVQSLLPGHGSTYNKSVQSLSNTTRKPLPLQQVELGESVEETDKESDESARARMLKKPVPTPRKGQKKEDGGVATQSSTKQQTLEQDSNLTDASLHNDSGLKKQPQDVPPSHSVDKSGPVSSFSEVNVPPALPPKPQFHHSVHLPILPRIPNKPRDISCDPNYMLVDIPSKPTSSTLPVEIKFSDTARKPGERVVYSEISHLKTEQLGNLIIERNKAKTQPNPRQ